MVYAADSFFLVTFFKLYHSMQLGRIGPGIDFVYMSFKYVRFMCVFNNCIVHLSIYFVKEKDLVNFDSDTYM